MSREVELRPVACRAPAHPDTPGTPANRAPRTPLVTGSRAGDWLLFAFLLATLVLSSWRLRVYFELPSESRRAPASQRQ